MANYTNTYNIPESIAKAIINDRYVKVGDYSATGLIRPPQMAVLEERYDSEITIDVSDGLWMLLGEAMHFVLEKGNHANSIIEARLSMPIGGITLSCKPDLYHIADKAIDDYKITSAYAFILGDKPDWTAQLNINRMIYEYNEFPVETLRIHAILRDWQRSKALADADYPQIPFQTVSIPMLADPREYALERIKLHEEAKRLPDEALPPCTDEERWMKKTTWAVMKEGRKSAVRVFDKREEAETYLHAEIPTKDLSKCHVEERKGSAIRCEGYCNASKFCKQWAKSGLQRP